MDCANRWRDAVVYEVYVRSFADADGDGTGDLAGLRSRLGHLADLGVDAVWTTPWYRSPMVDGGYDVEDHRIPDPLFGTDSDVLDLVAEVHRVGLRLLFDVVPNYTSDRRSMLSLYRAALAARRAHPGLGDGTLAWSPASPGVLSFAREPGFGCVVNLSAEPRELPEGGRVVMSSVLLEDGRLPVDAAAWLDRS
jgi:glycosidase